MAERLAETITAKAANKGENANEDRMQRDTPDAATVDQILDVLDLAELVRQSTPAAHRARPLVPVRRICFEAGLSPN
jgi:hypothetical protein